MAIYHISFLLNGRTHTFTGTSSYPSKELHNKNEVDPLIVEESAFTLIKTYMQQYQLVGPINSNTVTYNYELE